MKLKLSAAESASANTRMVGVPSKTGRRKPAAIQRFADTGCSSQYNAAPASMLAFY
jgi:hypothetical protein